MFNYLIKNGIIDGPVRENNRIIKCKWKKSKPIGIVEIKTPKIIYRGTYIEDNEICKYGSIEYIETNEFYEGSIINKNGDFIKHGYGKFVTNDLNSFSGIWDNDILHSGTNEILFNKNRIYKYIGEFENLKPTNGIYYIDDLTFVGEISGGNIKYIIKDGNINYPITKMKGIVTYPNGDIFEGVLENMKEIKGKRTYKNHETIIDIDGFLQNGSFKNLYTVRYKSGCIMDRKKSSYVFTLTDGVKISFDYIHDQKGHGKIIYSNNSSYEGIIKHNNNILRNGITKFSRDGKGIWYKNDGVVIDTTFENDLIKNVSEVKEKTATGETYFYTWIDGLRTGEGHIQVGRVIRKVIWLNGIPYEEKNEIIPTNLIHLRCPYCNNKDFFDISKNLILESDINDKNLCKICYENPVNVTIPNCRHTFCTECLLIVKRNSLI